MNGNLYYSMLQEGVTDPLGANNGCMPDYPQIHIQRTPNGAYTWLRITISRVRFTQFITYRLTPVPARCHGLNLGYSPDHGYCCFDHFRSLYISWYGLATLLF
ncbi:MULTISPECIES: hypothetical protein [Paenibacillus]|uniref:Uncharacterized protein n=1 Tax=Paenibacillus cucumis (ex Kampfer et al. 2016) TaxID=1776858 RepID=A0ABS7KRM4_9BACL|nr:hypothetical protein [Paenibacillus cucumis (ex Kampfer et al. 2016)]MBY0206626.1 hypothetical protein [Paenibacillus cucumis (ex Kampfer et al. 2016)]MDP9698402.1 hypothetical protein [Paenibacillus intestini]